MQATFTPLHHEFKKFFFDRARVEGALSKAKRSKLASQGALVRIIARRSIRKPKRMKLGDLPENEQLAYLIRCRMALEEGRPKPQLPFASSKPGEPPRNQTGLLKNHILFAYDTESESVVIGPALLNAGTGAPQVLEDSGYNDRGVFIAARPYMRPAMAQAVRSYPSVFKDSMR